MPSLLLPVLLLALSRAQPIRDCPSECHCTDTELTCSSVELTVVPQLMQTSLEILDLKNNSIREIARDTFDIYAAVQILQLPLNKIERIDDGAFTSNSALMKLNLAYNNLDRLYEDTFSGLTSLVSLNLTGNQLVEVFRALKFDRLKELYLGFNLLDEVPSSAFYGVQNLRILDLQSNRIGSIHPMAFEQLAHLRFLILKNNPLRMAASNLDLSQNSWLHVLDLTNCKIEQELKTLPKRLRDVRLSFNNITNITSMFKGAMYVDLIILNDNDLVYIDETAMRELPYLREVWLNRNSLDRIPNLPKYLRAVHMDDNRIETVDHNSFKVTPFVEIISLQNNLIKRLPSESFRNLRLRMIDVSMNQIAVLQRYTFSNLPVLYSVDLSRNPIQRLDTHSFDNVTNLHWLQLARTKVDMVEVESLEMLTMMKKLQYLDLSSSPGVANKLIQSGVVLTEVRTLNLMFNDLTTLPETFPGQIPNIRHLQLSGNKWHCNSSLAWLSDYILENENLFFAKAHIVCYTPLKWRGRAIHSLTLDELKAEKGPPVIDVQKCPECKEPCENGQEGGPEIIEDGTAVDEGGQFGPEPAEIRQSDQKANKVVRFKGKILTTQASPPESTRMSLDEVTEVRVHKVSGTVDSTLESASQVEMTTDGTAETISPSAELTKQSETTAQDSEASVVVADNPSLIVDQSIEKEQEEVLNVNANEQVDEVSQDASTVSKVVDVSSSQGSEVSNGEESLATGKTQETTSMTESPKEAQEAKMKEKKVQEAAVEETDSALTGAAARDIKQGAVNEAVVQVESKSGSDVGAVQLHNEDGGTGPIHQGNTGTILETETSYDAAKIVDEHSERLETTEKLPVVETSKTDEGAGEQQTESTVVSELASTTGEMAQGTEKNLSPVVSTETSPTTDDVQVREQRKKDEEIWQMMARMFRF